MFVHGRRAMISAATGAVALVIAPLVHEHGYDYLLVAILLAGVFQVILGVTGVAKLMRFIPRSVMVGFVNALAILVLLAQLPYVQNVPWLVYPMVAVGVALIVWWPRVTNAVPGPLIAIIVLTVVAVVARVGVPTVGDQGELPRALPIPVLPNVPWNLETLQIVLPYAGAVALVGLLESLLTAKLVDDITDTHSNKSREAWGQGGANIITAIFGGMGGCAVIGQTMMNVKVAGARTRISTFLSGVFLLILVVGLGDVVALIPMAALVAVMIMVSAAAFDWHSVRPSTLRRMPLSETIVMLTTVVITVWTHNLAYGVITGTLVAMVGFARRVAHFTQVTAEDGPGPDTRTYRVRGQLFFASSNDLVTQFDYIRDPANVIIDMSETHIWDASTVASLDAIATKYATKGKTLTITGLNPDSSFRHESLSGNLS